MKLWVLVMVTLVVGVVRSDDEVNAEQMVQYIRNRGTFLASVVNMTQKLEEDDVKVRQAAIDAYQALLNISFGPEYVMKLNTTEYNYYNNTEVELPVICNPDKNAQNDANKQINENDFLKWDEVTSIVVGGKKMLKCWNTAGGTEADTLTLPVLNAVQFAQFYRCATIDFDEKLIPENYIQASDGMANPQALLTVVTWGDTNRQDFSWLELWVYMCSKGRQPKENKYMAKQADEMTAYMQESIKKRQRQAYARNTMDLQKSMKDLKDLVKDIQKGKTEATYKNDKADDIVKDAMGKRLRKRKHSHSHSKMNKEQKKGLLKLLEEKIQRLDHIQGLIDRSDKIIEKEQKEFKQQQERRLKKHHSSKKHHKSERVKKMNKIEKMLEDFADEYNKNHQKENEECVKKSTIGRINKDLGEVFQQIGVKLKDKKVLGMLRKMRLKKEVHHRHSRKH